MWTASYLDRDKKPFVILETSTSECPTSLLEMSASDDWDPREVVQEYAKFRIMRETFGTAPYGGNLDEWPAKLVDAFLVLREQEIKVNNLSQGTPTSPEHQAQLMAQRMAQSQRGRR